MSPLGLKKFRKYAMINSFSGEQSSGLYPFSGQIFIGSLLLWLHLVTINLVDYTLIVDEFFLITPYNGTKFSVMHSFSGQFFS